MNELEFNKELVAKTYLKHGKAVAELVKYFFENIEKFKGGVIIDRIFGIKKKKQKLLDWQKYSGRKADKKD